MPATKRFTRETYVRQLNDLARYLHSRGMLTVLREEHFEPAPAGWAATGEASVEGWHGQVLVEIEGIDDEPATD